MDPDDRQGQDGMTRPWYALITNIIIFIELWHYVMYALEKNDKLSWSRLRDSLAVDCDRVFYESKQILYFVTFEPNTEHS